MVKLPDKLRYRVWYYTSFKCIEYIKSKNILILFDGASSSKHSSLDLIYIYNILTKNGSVKVNSFGHVNINDKFIVILELC